MPLTIAGLLKPEYMSRPSQILRRAWRGVCRPPATARVRLPWGSILQINPGETIGRLIYLTGVFDLAVTEALWRLTDPGDTAIDVGGNIGYTACLFARRVGNAGMVHVFEPHPEVVLELTANSRRWRTPLHGRVVIHEKALGRHSGVADLNIPSDFRDNHGLASIRHAGPRAKSLKVVLEQIDALDEEVTRARIAKIDVEGAEVDVLMGATRVLQSGNLRDIVFEDSGSMPTEAARILSAHGYAVFSLRVSDAGPVITPIGEPEPALRLWDSPSYLATLDVPRMRQRYEKPGWSCLAG